MNWGRKVFVNETAKKIIKPAFLFFMHQASKLKIKQLLREKEAILLEIGAGNKKGQNGWLTMDIRRDCDLLWDLRKGIPFPDDSVCKIYSSHFFEHLSFQEGQQFLDECLRVLSPGGEFSICVPNARLYVEAYLANTNLDEELFFGFKPEAYNNTTKIDYLNYTAYMDGDHKYMFDENNLIHILESRGMKNVRLREFDPSIDLPERDFESIYATAVK